MAFQDQTLTCRDCGNQFVWTASEQEFYQSKGFQNAPVRCPADRAAKKARMDGGGRGGPRQMYEITCSVCGKKDMVPFQPRGDRPVLCAEHFRQQREERGGGDRSDRDYKSNQANNSNTEESPEQAEPESNDSGTEEASEKPVEEEKPKSE